ncbi:MAG: ferric reductase-like transmembrane domain-containing protein [Candidatus Micrarchaeia archaeon]|jgi:sulfoxide reductase heme-binding subunit YedZ
MQKSSFLFLLTLSAVALLAAYHATLSGPTSSLFIRFLGLSGFMLLSLTLMIGPLITIWPNSFGQLFEPRRALGILSAVFVFIHIFLVSMMYFNFNVVKILSFLPLQVGAVAAFLFAVLTITSSDYAIKKLGKFWKPVQQLTYLAFIFSFTHLILIERLIEGARPANLAELSIMLFAVLAVVLQLVGFLKRKGLILKTAEAAAK